MVLKYRINYKPYTGIGISPSKDLSKMLFNGASTLSRKRTLQATRELAGKIEKTAVYQLKRSITRHTRPGSSGRMRESVYLHTSSPGSLSSDLRRTGTVEIGVPYKRAKLGGAGVTPRAYIPHIKKRYRKSGPPRGLHGGQRPTPEIITSAEAEINRIVQNHIRRIRGSFR